MSRHGWMGATAFLMWAATAGLASADIFAFADTNGSVTLSNFPADDGSALILHIREEQALPGQETVAPAPAPKARPYAAIVEEAARINKLDDALLHAVIAAESGYNPSAVSSKGASGLMQLMPQTARSYGVTNSYDPSDNVRGGARYLRDLLQMFNNDVRLALAAYNAGENAVARFGNNIPPYRETTDYVDKVMALYGRMRKGI